MTAGLYVDEEGRLPVLQSVREAQEDLLRCGGPTPYLPIEGSTACQQSGKQGGGHHATSAPRSAVRAVVFDGI